MKAYVAQTLINLKLTFRDKTVLFFNYAFPLIFFFVFAGLYKAERGGAIVTVLTMVVTIGILGTGFFGAGIRSVQERETGILRRFKVAPITPAPMLLSSIITGLISYLPAGLLLVVLSHVVYGMPWPQRWLSLLLYVSLGVIAFRSFGLIIASVVNSMQESQILVQLIYFPMLMLSGATIPLSLLPHWLQIVAQFIPSTYLITGVEGILGRGETFGDNIYGAGALLLTALLALFVSMKLFRWEKEERLAPSAKFYVLAVLAPFFILGVYQSRTHENLTKERLLVRDQRRGRTFLVRDVRIFTGDGQVIESGAVLVKAGKIEQVYDGAAPDPKSLDADVVEGSGKTLLPGLIDMHVHLGGPGGFSDGTTPANPDATIPRELAAYLYSGVTAVRSVGDPLDALKSVRASVRSGERLGAELFLCGPMFTTAGGHGTEYYKALPEKIRKLAEAQAVRTPKTPEEARQQVDALKAEGVDGIKAILEQGTAGMLFNRIDLNILRAIGLEAHAKALTLAIHTGYAKDVADALDAGPNSLEHGSTRDAIPADSFRRMKEQGVAYDPTLAVLDAFRSLAAGTTELLDRTLVQQVGPQALLTSTRAYLKSHSKPGSAVSMDFANQNLKAAWDAGVPLVTGTDSGNPLVWHGPAIHRELQLWVEAGIPPQVALKAATFNGARLLGVGDRLGQIARGRDATMLLVSGNPLTNIRDTENITYVFFKGEQLNRPELFHQDQ